MAFRKLRQPIRIIATLPPYVDHRQEIIDHPLVSELRFNTVSPLDTTREKMLARLQKECGRKPLWIDLKGRQLRIAKFAYLPYAFVELNHRIEVDLPAEILFKDCTSTVVRIVDGNKLILGGRPERVVGEGEPVNIIHPSLKIEGFLTDSDWEYADAAYRLGLNSIMLSFVERWDDVMQLNCVHHDARAMLKIESLRGLAYLERWRPNHGRLMAARDDLAIQCRGREELLVNSLRRIGRLDPTAVCASRLFRSLEEDDRRPVALADIADFELMLRFGYRTFMLSDGLCFHRPAFRRTMEFLDGYLGERIVRDEAPPQMEDET
jgi:hypothetical protein